MNKMLLKKEVWLPIAILIIVGSFVCAFNLNNNFIHIFNGILVFWLLKRFDLGISKGRTLAVAFLTSLIFLIHPLQTEAITYISGRGDALVAMFMLLALLFFYKSELTTSDVQLTSDVKTSAN